MQARVVEVRAKLWGIEVDGEIWAYAIENSRDEYFVYSRLPFLECIHKAARSLDRASELTVAWLATWR